MSVQDKIMNAYHLYILCNKSIKETLKLTKITRPTLHKYIRIQECLDFSLLEYLDKSGKLKLKLSDALYLCENVLNPEQQYEVFQSFINAPKKNRIEILKENTTCMICADSKSYFEYTPCCNQLICEECFSKTMETYIQDIIFKPANCPFCDKSISLHYIKWFMNDRKISKELWRNTARSHLHYSYMTNLYKKYITMIGKIELSQDYIISDSEPDFKTLLGEDKYFGPCSQCTPKFTNQDYRIIGLNEWKNILICDIPRQCGNGEGGILVLEPEMFRCIVCKSKDEDYDNGEFKKCPHCGIRTLKPDGCNYIYCGDHRWCFICNERLENNENGHNKHFWTGPGTSPYSNQCRQSINSDSPKFTITGKCDCSSCKEHSGKPLCRTLDCMNRTKEDGLDMGLGGLDHFTHCETCWYEL